MGGNGWVVAGMGGGEWMGGSRDGGGGEWMGGSRDGGGGGMDGW